MLLSIIFYLALTAEAMTAALAAGRRRMDWFGVCLLASVTALGGGTMRDILLDHYPIAWIANPWLLVLICGAALLTIGLARLMPYLRWAFLLLDGVGLVIFTVIGCDIALAMGQHPIIVIVAGMVTGIVGGILRDVLCNDVPLVFSGELYATVSIVTGVIYSAGVWWGFPHEIAVIAALAVGFPLRVASIRYKLGMPKFIYDEDPPK